MRETVLLVDPEELKKIIQEKDRAYAIFDEKYQLILLDLYGKKSEKTTLKKDG